MTICCLFPSFEETFWHFASWDVWGPKDKQQVVSLLSRGTCISTLPLTLCRVQHVARPPRLCDEHGMSFLGPGTCAEKDFPCTMKSESQAANEAPGTWGQQ